MGRWIGRKVRGKGVKEREAALKRKKWYTSGWDRVEKKGRWCLL
jgi:hypothetical protein